MKHILILIATVLALAGCGGTTGDLVKVVESVTDENTSTAKGVTAGMSSSDAANVLMNRDYYAAAKAIANGGTNKGERSPLVEIEAHEGQPITINAKSFKVYAPPVQYAGGGGLTLKAPLNVESSGIKWFREIKDAVIGTAQVALPWKMVREQGKTQRHVSDNDRDVRLGELGVMGDAVNGATGLGGLAITTFKPATPIVVPAAAPATATAPAPVAE
jgi:hypothetical protein